MIKCNLCQIFECKSGSRRNCSIFSKITFDFYLLETFKNHSDFGKTQFESKMVKIDHSQEVREKCLY